MPSRTPRASAPARSGASVAPIRGRTALPLEGCRPALDDMRPSVTAEVRRSDGLAGPYDVRMRRLLDAGYWMLLAAWFALAVAGGLAAAAMFPAARELPLALDGYEAFIAARPDEGRMLVAGHLAEAVFTLAGRLSLVVAPLALALLALRLAVDRWRGLLVLAVPAAIATAALLHGQLRATPSFREIDGLYRAAARAGDLEVATVRKEEVDAAHASASRAASLEAGAVLALIAVSGFLSRPVPLADDRRPRRSEA